MYSYGLIQLVNGLFGGWVAGTSLSRSSVNETAGVVTKVCVCVLVYPGFEMSECAICLFMNA